MQFTYYYLADDSRDARPTPFLALDVAGDAPVLLLLRWDKASERHHDHLLPNDPKRPQGMKLWPPSSSCSSPLIFFPQLQFSISYCFAFMTDLRIKIPFPLRVTRYPGGSESIFPSWQFFQHFFPRWKKIYHSTHDCGFWYFFLLSRHDFLSPSNFQQFPFHWAIEENFNNFPKTLILVFRPLFFLSSFCFPHPSRVFPARFKSSFSGLIQFLPLTLFFRFTCLFPPFILAPDIRKDLVRWGMY